MTIRIAGFQLAVVASDVVVAAAVQTNVSVLLHCPPVDQAMRKAVMAAYQYVPAAVVASIVVAADAHVHERDLLLRSPAFHYYCPRKEFQFHRLRPFFFYEEKE